MAAFEGSPPGNSLIAVRCLLQQDALLHVHLQKGGKPNPRAKAEKAEGVLVAVTSEAKVCMHPTPLMPLCASLPGFLPLLLTQMSSFIVPCFQVEVDKELLAKEVRVTESQKVNSDVCVVCVCIRDL